jgi:O-antigen ligase
MSINKKETIVTLLILLFFATLLLQKLTLNSRIIIFITILTCIAYKFEFRKKVIAILALAFAPYLLVHLLFSFCHNPFVNTIHSLTTKASFIAFPIIFAQLHFIQNKNLLLKITTILTALLVFMFGFMLVSAFQNFMIDNDLGHFFYSGLCGPYMHTGYLSNFFMFCFLFFYYEFKSNKNNLNIAIALLLLTMLIFIACKTAYLCLIIFGLIEGFVWIKNLKQLKHKFMLLACFVILGVGVYQIPPIQKRIVELVNVNNVKTEAVNTTHSSPIRKLIWKCEWDIIKRNPIIGYGTGAADSLLVIEYKKNNYTYLLENVTGGPLHSHNQFLHQWIDQGILGLLTLLFLLAYCFYIFNKHAYYMGSWWIVFMSLVIFTDDVLEIHVCVSFIALSISLLMWDCWRMHYAKEANNLSV